MKGLLTLGLLLLFLACSNSSPREGDHYSIPPERTDIPRPIEFVLDIQDDTKALDDIVEKEEEVSDPDLQCLCDETTTDEPQLDDEVWEGEDTLKPEEGPCVPDCNGKVCGPDGCGGICGYCQYGYVCKDGLCVEICIPDCIEKGKLCGPDGCGGECPPGCEEGFECRDDFRCHPVECIPDCTGRVCGYGANGGCGNPKECGECAPGQSCTEAGQCVAGPCMGITEKGKCLDPYTVAYCQTIGGQMTLIKIDCKQFPDKVCGWNGWENKFDCIDKPPCVPNCILEDGSKKECGDDGCGGSCGQCPLGWGCPGFKCRPVEGASCGWITEQGYCWYDNWLYYCTGPVESGKIGAENCTAQGKICAYDAEFSHAYQCMTPP